VAERGAVNAPMPMNYKLYQYVGLVCFGIAVPYEACINPIL
jgi:hypothetical protein